MMLVLIVHYYICLFFFFFNDTATTEIYPLSLHDALPISHHPLPRSTGVRIFIELSGEHPTLPRAEALAAMAAERVDENPDRKSTRLNSSHDQISYAVFCLKKKNIISSIHHERAMLAHRAS